MLTPPQKAFFSTLDRVQQVLTSILNIAVQGRVYNMRPKFLEVPRCRANSISADHTVFLRLVLHSQQVCLETARLQLWHPVEVLQSQPHTFGRSVHDNRSQEALGYKDHLQGAMVLDELLG